MSASWQVIECEATFAVDGRPRPWRFVWDDLPLAVVDVGRRWADQDGLHLVARVQDGRVFELWYHATGWRARVLSNVPGVA